MSHHPPVRIPFGLVNAYLLRGKEGDVLIDTGLPGFAGRLLRVLLQGSLHGWYWADEHLKRLLVKHAEVFVRSR